MGFMGVVADDITGANDIGIMFAKWGLSTYVASLQTDGSFPAFGHLHADIIILNTNSRMDPPALAYEKVFRATRALRAAGFRQFYKKTCSVFRGNIGVEFDAMLDALGESFAVVVLGFPKNGRTTRNGIHYVHGSRLEESEFCYDPIHPMTRSNLVEILQLQTERYVELVDFNLIRQGAAALAQELQSRRFRCQYLIMDVPDQEALAVIAQAVQQETVLCGSSAIAEELAPIWVGSRKKISPARLPAKPGCGILTAVGSLMPQSIAQTQWLAAMGCPEFTLNVPAMLEETGAQKYLREIADQIAYRLQQGQDVVFHTPNQPDAVQAVKEFGAQLGLSSTEIARRISSAVAEVCAMVLQATGQNRLIVGGGETSDAVCQRLGGTLLQIDQEIAPGLPSCIAQTAPPLMLVLKSGSFGKPDFFERALIHLRANK